VRTHTVLVCVAVIAGFVVLARIFDRYAALTTHAIGKCTTDQTIMNTTDATRSLAAQSLFDATRAWRQSRLAGRHRRGTRRLGGTTAFKKLRTPGHDAAVFRKRPLATQVAVAGDLRNTDLAVGICFAAPSIRKTLL
jgi:hypothetical protein